MTWIDSPIANYRSCIVSGVDAVVTVTNFGEQKICIYAILYIYISGK